MSSNNFLELIGKRRTHYQLASTSPISDSRIQEIIENVILNVPSAFNSQTVRVILLLKEEHRKLWDITKEVLKGVVPEDLFAATEKKLNGFQAAYGTVSLILHQQRLYNCLQPVQVLFFDHRPTLHDFQARFALYADRLPDWAVQSNGMHQFAVWTAFESEGLGANLQHYNPLIDAKIAAEWNISKDWNLSGQLVFGTPIGKPSQKTFKPMEERLRVLGA